MRICLLLPRMPLPITLPRKALLLSRMPLPILLLRMALLRMAPLRKPAILCFPLTAMTLRPPLPIRMPALPIQTLPVRIQPLPVRAQPLPIRAQPLPVRTQPLPIRAQPLPVRVRPLPGHPGKLLIRQPPILQTRKNPPKEILLQKLLNDLFAK